jgi:hypothetical protein
LRRKQERRSPDTLALSPHINYFSWTAIRRVVAGAQLDIRDYRGRTFLCGFGFDHVLRGRRLIAWNARVADSLPAALVSDWMLLLEPVPELRSAGGYRRGAYARMRRRLNERRCGLR